MNQARKSSDVELLPSYVVVVVGVVGGGGMVRGCICSVIATWSSMKRKMVDHYYQIALSQVNLIPVCGNFGQLLTCYSFSRLVHLHHIYSSCYHV